MCEHIDIRSHVLVTFFSQSVKKNPPHKERTYAVRSALLCFSGPPQKIFSGHTYITRAASGLLGWPCKVKVNHPRFSVPGKSI